MSLLPPAHRETDLGQCSFALGCSHRAVAELADAVSGGKGLDVWKSHGQQCAAITRHALVRGF